MLRFLKMVCSIFVSTLVFKILIISDISHLISCWKRLLCVMARLYKIIRFWILITKTSHLKKLSSFDHMKHTTKRETKSIKYNNYNELCFLNVDTSLWSMRMKYWIRISLRNNKPQVGIKSCIEFTHKLFYPCNDDEKPKKNYFKYNTQTKMPTKT